MYIFDTVYVCCMMCYISVYSAGRLRRVDSEVELNDETLPEDHHTFVALIDIVFTNGVKRTCTGTIIHDNVVLTAAHCFTLETDHSIQPEITASFIVIGTKKMFDTGYEQYLPVERIIMHSKFKGWTADLALVYTFAGMTADKPGEVIPLATEKSSTPVDSEVMVFSWGKCTDDDVTVSHYEYFPEIELTTVFEDKVLKFDDEYRQMKENDKLRQRRKKHNRIKSKNKKTEYVPVTRARGSSFGVTTKLDKKITSIEENSQYEGREQYVNFTESNSDVEEKRAEKKLAKLNQLYKRSEVNRDRMNQRDRRETRGTMPYYSNGWRRKMGNQLNKLTVEIFGFVNMQACQKMLHKSAAASLHRIKNRHEILCYNSERRYITEDDAGAPAIRKGRLVAVTLGGADFEGEHVAIGMKMVCFCSWIADNLPKNGRDLHCCKNCCDSSFEEAEIKKSKRHSHKKRKL